jgi:hypothetical protein
VGRTSDLVQEDHLWIFLIICSKVFSVDSQNVVFCMAGYIYLSIYICIYVYFVYSFIILFEKGLRVMPRLASKVLAQWTPSPSTFQVVCAHCTCPGVLTLQQIHNVDMNKHPETIVTGFAFANVRNRLNAFLSHT